MEASIRLSARPPPSLPDRGPRSIRAPGRGGKRTRARHCGRTSSIAPGDPGLCDWNTEFSRASAAYHASALRSTPAEDSVPGLPPRVRLFPLLARNQLRELGHFLRQQLNQIVDGDNSHQIPLFGHDRDAAYAGAAHLVDRLEDPLVLENRLQFRPHDVARGKHAWIEAQRDYGHHDVAVSYDSDWRAVSLRAVEHKQVTHMILTHQQRSFLNRRVSRCGHYLANTAIANRHDTAPFERSQWFTAIGPPNTKEELREYLWFGSLATWRLKGN